MTKFFVNGESVDFKGPGDLTGTKYGCGMPVRTTRTPPSVCR